MAEKDLEVVKTKEELYEEIKQERLAEKNRRAKLRNEKVAQRNKTSNKTEVYRNPIKSIWGKVIVWILCLAMVASILFSFIYLLIKSLM